jgi:hypothetical protein
MGGSGHGGRASSGLTYGWAWPGVPQLWRGGEWQGFASAAAFALLLNLQLLTSFIYTELLPTTLVALGWIGLLGFWIGGLVLNRRWSRRQLRTADARKLEETLYEEAFHDYLQRNWIAAETKCRELIRRRRGDVDARLLLATVLRHADRWEESARELDALAKIEGSEKWALEMALERRSLDEARQNANNSGIDEASGDEPGTLSMSGHAARQASPDDGDATDGADRVIRKAA